MKFACPKCNTRYSIGDDKVPLGKVLKFPCKTCGNVVRLRRKEGDATGSAQILDTVPAAARPAADPVETTRIASVSEINKLRNASTEATRTINNSAVAASAVADVGGGLGEATRVVSLEQMNQLRKSAQATEQHDDTTVIDEPTTIAPAPSAPASTRPAAAAAVSAGADDVSEWFVLIAGKQRGPMAPSAIDQMLAKNEIDRRTFLWKSGMANWERLANLPRFAGSGTIAPAAAPVSGTAETRTLSVPASVAAKANDSAKNRAVEQASSREPALQPAQRPASARNRALEPTPMAAAATAADDDDESFSLSQDALDEITTSSVFDESSDEAHDHSHNNAIAAELHSEESEPHGFYKAETQVVMDPRIAAQQAHAQIQARAEERRRAEAGTMAAAQSFRPTEDSPGFGAPPPVQDARGTDSYGETGDPLAGLDDPHNLQSFDDVSQNLDLPDEHSGMDSLQNDPNYLQAAPGESTKVYMATAGIYKKRRNNRIAAMVAAAAVVLIAGFIIMDQQGLIVLPGMGAMYDVSGVEDPNIDRALERTENKLAAEDLDPKKRAQLESLRRKLLDKTNSEASVGTKHNGGGSTQKQPDAGSKEGVPNEQTGAEQHDMAQQLFDDARKQNVDVKLASPDAIQTPNLPDGLTQEAIYKVVNDNNTSMKLCYAEAARKGEKLAGKMEVQMTIDATGEVSGADINTPQFKSSTMGQCTVRRVKTWKFPRFNGQPVTVVFPYVLQSAF